MRLWLLRTEEPLASDVLPEMHAIRINRLEGEVMGIREDIRVTIVLFDLVRGRRSHGVQNGVDVLEGGQDR